MSIVIGLDSAARVLEKILDLKRKIGNNKPFRDVFEWEIVDGLEAVNKVKKRYSNESKRIRKYQRGMTRKKHESS